MITRYINNNYWITTDLMVYFFAMMVLYVIEKSWNKWIGLFLLAFIMWHKVYSLNKQIKQKNTE